MKNDQLNDRDFFETSDFPLIATLCMFLPVEAVDRDDPQRFHFVFRRSKELEKLLESYYRKELRIEPEAFYYAIKGVKTRLYNHT